MNDWRQPESWRHRHDWFSELRDLWTFASTAECPMYVWHLFTIQLNIVLILIGLSNGIDLWVMVLVSVMLHFLRVISIP